MARLTVVINMSCTHGYGLDQAGAEEIADNYLRGGEFPGAMISRSVELEPEDAAAPDVIRGSLRLIKGGLSA